MRSFFEASKMYLISNLSINCLLYGISFIFFVQQLNNKSLQIIFQVEFSLEITCKCIQEKFNNKYFNILGNKKNSVKELLNIIKKYKPNIKIFYSKKNNKMYNYKTNPFTYKLRVGKQIKLKKYITLEKGLKNLLISSVKQCSLYFRENFKNKNNLNFTSYIFKLWLFYDK